MSRPETLPEKLERLARSAESEGQVHPDRDRRLYCEGTAHGLREAARMVREQAEGRGVQVSEEESVLSPGDVKTWKLAIFRRANLPAIDVTWHPSADRARTVAKEWQERGAAERLTAVIHSPDGRPYQRCVFQTCGWRLRWERL